jgi:hypothetical protein
MLTAAIAVTAFSGRDGKVAQQLSGAARLSHSQRNRSANPKK